MGELEIQEFLQILRSGNHEAAERAIAWLAPWLRRAISLRLVDGRVRRVTDTGDVFQSLMKDFLERGPDDGATPQNGACAKKYLIAAVHNKIVSRLRKEKRHSGSLASEPLSPEACPATQVEGRDLIDTVRKLLRDENHWPFDRRVEGFTWPEIAMPYGIPSDTMRMRLRRSVAHGLCKLKRG
jgi:DNA-directed RNA polymerase specialized sigma24 family protein